MAKTEGHGKRVSVEIGKMTVLAVALFLILALGLVRVYYMNGFTAAFAEKVAAAKDAAKPASLQLTKLVDSSCTDCFDMGNIVRALQPFNVNITSTATLDYSSADAKALVGKYGITAIPALLISGDIAKPGIASLWAQVGKVVGGTVVIDSKNFPPYTNVTTGNVEGRVSVVFLNDSSCGTCYDVNVHRQILPRFMINATSVTTYDVGSDKGKALAAKYNITKVPTVLLSPDAKLYANLVSVWAQVGSVESDGWFVFRATEQMGAYLNLTSGDVVGQQKVNTTSGNAVGQ